MGEIGIGDKVGRYQLKAEIGRGGMGIVYRAQDTILGREVAVKLLQSSVTDKNKHTRFLQEAIAASSLNHPNILTVYDIVDHQGHSFIAMELVEGQTVHQLISNGPIAVEQALNIIIQAAEGLSVAHNLGIIHRDIKPENLIVRPDGYIKILDFGLAKINLQNLNLTDASTFGRLEALSDNVAMIGTAPYMSPEQIRGEDIDARSDLFSLAVVMYEMLTGVLPFNADNVIDTIEAILKSEPIPPSKQHRQLNEEFDAFFIKALAKNRAARYQNTVAFIKALKLLINETQSASTSSIGTLPLENGQSFAATIEAAVKSMETEALPINFVGRARELDQLMHIFNVASHSHGQLAVITGDAGLGKSALVSEFRHRVGDKADFIVGRFYDDFCALPYGVFLDALCDYVSLLPAKTTDLFGQIFEDRGTDLESALRRRDIVHASDLLKLKGSTEQLTRSSEALRRAFTVLVKRNKPLIFLLDNLQWADSASLQTLKYIVKHCVGIPILFIAAVRNEELETDDELKSWLRSVRNVNNFHLFELAPFNLGEVGAMFTHLCPGVETDTQLLNTLYNVTGGNPYFVREMIMLWLEDGAICDREKRWQSPAPEAGVTMLPKSISDLVELRLNKLSASALDVLTHAAVIGTEFSFNLLLRVSGVSEAHLNEVLDDAIHRRLIDERGGNREDKYAFHHVNIQQVLYQRLNKRQSRQIHEKVAKSLAAKFTGPLDKAIPQMAYHYRGANIAEQAFEYSVYAADLSRRAGNVEEQAKYLDWASDFNAQISTEIKNKSFVKALGLYKLCMGNLYSLRGKMDKARNFLNDALQISERLNDDSLRGSVNNAIGLMNLLVTDYPAAQKAFVSSIASFERLGDNTQRLEALSGFALSKSFDVKEMERASRWLLSVAGNSTQAKGFAYTTLGLANFQTGLLGHATDYYRRALSNLDRSGDSAHQARTFSLMGSLYAYLRCYDQALEYSRRGLELASYTNFFAELTSRSAMVPILLHLGEVDQAIENAQKVLKMSQQSGNKLYTGMSHLELGFIEQQCGRHEKAIERYRRAINIFNTIHYRYRLAEACAAMGECYLKVGKIDAAVISCNSGFEASRHDRLRHPYWQTSFVMAKALIARNSINEAKGYLQESKVVLNEMAADLGAEIVNNFLSDKDHVFNLCRQYEV